jgi:ABC-type amino acid transport substrate-binding protein
MRIWSYGIEHSDVIRVPTSYYFLETTAFYQEGADIEISSKKDLEKYSVLKIRGVKHTNTATVGLTNVYDFDDTETMLKALNKRRRNVALTHRGDGLFAIRKYRIQGIEFSKSSLFTFPLYHYVHKKNAHLVDKVNRMILEMKETGELDKLVRSAERQVLELSGLYYN